MASLKDSFTTVTSEVTQNWQNFDYRGQTFTTTSAYTCTSIKLKIGSVEAKSGDVELYAVDGSSLPTGSILASVPYNAVDFGNPGALFDFVWTTPVALSNATEYAVVVKIDTRSTGQFIYGEGTDQYANGLNVSSDDAGSTWTSAASDSYFEVYGETSADFIPSDKKYTQNLVTFSASKVFYGTKPSDMAELTAASGVIDTSKPLQATAGLGKVFVANGSTKYVVDFVNTRLSAGAQITTNIPVHGDLLTQAGASAATMVVDYIFWTGSIHYVYGYTSAGTFETGTAVIDASSNTIITAANMDAVDEATTTPHWYSWTPYNDDSTTYGSLPTKAEISCFWRARTVLSGDPAHPEQWYMPRQANPWDWKFVASDDQSAIAGQDGRAGLVGDVIVALIPLNDDLLLVGATHSIHLFEGDPAEGGSIAEMSVITGMYGPRSWCVDSDGRVYFMGSQGISVITDIQSRTIVPLSTLALPDLLQDESLDPDTKRVVLSYDRENQGIWVFITTLTTGANSNYFYSLKLNGFYPQSFPVSNGVYSSLFYDSEDSSIRQLVFGSFDGYTRFVDRAAKDDDIGGSDTAISSFVTIPMVVSGGQEPQDVIKLRALRFEMAGGASGGANTDFDAFTYEVYAADDPETAIEDILDSATPNVTGSVSAGGLSDRKRARARGRSLMLHIKNSTATETWSINKIMAELREEGRE